MNNTILVNRLLDVTIITELEEWLYFQVLSVEGDSVKYLNSLD